MSTTLGSVKVVGGEVIALNRRRMIVDVDVEAQQVRLPGPLHITLENHVPPPTSRQGRPCIYPWATMQIGDSFTVSRDHLESHAIRSAASAAGKRLGRSFITRKEGMGCRVWRAAVVLLLALIGAPAHAQELSWAMSDGATGYVIEVRSVTGTWKALPVNYVCVDGTCTAIVTPPKGVRLYRLTAIRGAERTVRLDAGLWLDGREQAP